MRNAVRDALPAPSRRGLRSSNDHRHPVLLRQAILREVDGAGSDNRAALRRSAVAAPSTSLGNFHCWRDPALLPYSVGAVTNRNRRLIGATGHAIAVETLPKTAGRLRVKLALHACSDVTIVEAPLAAEEGRC